MRKLFVFAIRNLLKDKTNLLINVFGLGIGFLSFIFILFWFLAEKSYDSFWSRSEDIYRVELNKQVNGQNIFSTAMNYRGVGPVLQNEIPEIVAATNLDKDIISVFTPDAFIQNINMFFTDTSFFSVFPINVECSNKKLIFKDIHSAIISKSLAQKLFGNQNPINKSFKLNEGWEFYVFGVFDDIPENSHIKFDLLLSRNSLTYYMRHYDYATGKLDNSNIDNYNFYRDPYSQGQWSSIRSYTYIRLQNSSKINEIKSKYRKAILTCTEHLRNDGENLAFDFKPITQIHLASEKNDEMFVNGSMFRVKACIVIALLLLFTSLVNYNNLNIANTIKDNSKANIKRILGASHLGLFSQKLFEAFTLNTIVGAICLVLSYIILHNGLQIESFVIFPVKFMHIVLSILGLIAAGTLISGVYPFFRSAVKFRKLWSGENILAPKSATFSLKSIVVFQFATAVFLIIGTYFISNQIRFMLNKDTGMDMDQTLVSFSPMTMIKKPEEPTKLKTFREEVLKIPGVKAFTTAEIRAGRNYHRFRNDITLQDNIQSKHTFALANIDYDYTNFFDLELVEGTHFARPTNDNSQDILVNESACLKLQGHPKDIINKFLEIGDQQYRIIGVLKDFHQTSLKDEIYPAVFLNSQQWFRSVGHYYVKVSPVNMQETIAGIKKLWESVYPEEKYYFSFLDKKFNEAYKAEILFGRIYMVLSVLTIFIACLGLFALVNYTTNSRIKEIGVRKVNGAKGIEILSMLNSEYLRWIALAYMIALPLGWFVMKKWLENYAYRISLNWWGFILSGLLVLIIALATVSWRSWKAATRNPVEALRYE